MTVVLTAVVSLVLIVGHSGRQLSMESRREKKKSAATPPP